MTAALRPGGVAPVAEALAAGALEALACPRSCALAVGAAIGAVGHVQEGQPFHVGPRLEQPALRVLEPPEPGLEVVDELQRPERHPVAFLQAARPPGQGLRQRTLSPAGLLAARDNIRPAEEGRLADLTFVRKKEDRRVGLVGRLPYVGPGWYGKPATAFMLDSGGWTPPPTSRRTASPGPWRSWSEPGPRARSTWPSSPSTLSSDSGPGPRTSSIPCEHRHTRWTAGAASTSRSSSTTRASATTTTSTLQRALLQPLHAARPRFRHGFGVRGAGEDSPGPARGAASLPGGAEDRLPGLSGPCAKVRAHRHTVEALTRRRHRDGTPKYRFEEVKRLEGEYQEPRLETVPPTEQEPWRHVEDPVEHCPNGHSLLLSGMPGTGKTHLARQIVSQLSQLGEGVTLISKTQDGGPLGAEDHPRGRCSLDWLVVEEVTQLDVLLWADIAELFTNRRVRFLLLGESPSCCTTWRAAACTSSRRTGAATRGSFASCSTSESTRPSRSRCGTPRGSSSHSAGCRTPAWSSHTPIGWPSMTGRSGGSRRRGRYCCSTGRRVPPGPTSRDSGSWGPVGGCLRAAS